MNVPQSVFGQILKRSVVANQMFWMRTLIKGKKVDPKTLIRLFDQSGNPIGIKSKTEAEEYAKKIKALLEPKKDRPGSKYPEFILKSRIDEDVPSKTSATKSFQSNEEVKRFVFASSISDHDFEYRLRQIVKYLLKNHSVKITIPSKANDKEKLDYLYNQLKERLGVGVKFAHKALSGSSMKLMINPVEEQKEFLQKLDAHFEKNQIKLDEEENLNQEEIEELVQDFLKKK